MLLPIGIKDTIARYYAWEVFAESVAGQLEPPINNHSLKIVANYYMRACVNITPQESPELVNEAARQGLELAGVNEEQSAQIISEHFTEASILQYFSESKSN